MFCSKCGEKNSEEAKFCKGCGSQLQSSQSAPNSIPKTQAEVAHSTKSPKSVLYYVLMPIVFFIGIIIFWGIINITGSENSPLIEFINNVLIPVFLGLTFLALPVGVIYGIYINSKHYDGTIKCGNCEYVGVGKPGRSVWAQVLVWILFFISPLITIIYYLATHRYKCPKCDSTFIGLRDVNGNYSATKSGLGPLGIVLLVFLLISIIGILAAVVLASLNDARNLGQDAAIKQSLGSLRVEAELYYDKNNYSYKGFCEESQVEEIATSLNVAESSFHCYDNTYAYAISAPLISGKNYCVDSTEPGTEIEGPLSYRTYCSI